MKRSMIRILLAALALWTLVVLSACGGGQQQPSNTNTNVNSTAGAGGGSNPSAAVAPPSAQDCSSAVYLQDYITTYLDNENGNGTHYGGDLKEHRHANVAPLSVTVSAFDAGHF